MSVSERPVSDRSVSERPAARRRTGRSTKAATRSCVVAPGTNLVLLRGSVAGEPVARELSSGRSLISLDLSVRPEEGPVEVVPVAWFDPPARASQLQPGTEVCVLGRVRRRFFRSGGATISRTEVVATAIVSASAPSQVRRALEPLLDAVAAFE